MNLYGYGDGDPINNSDPFGTWAVPLVQVGIVLATPIVRAAAQRLIHVAAAGISVAVSGYFESATRSPGYSGTPSLAAPADATAFSSRRPRGQVIREWEDIHGRPFPEGCIAHHICPLADGGADTGANIEPLTPGDHVRHHKDNGDFRRWAQRRKGNGKKEESGGEQKPDEPKKP